MFEVIFCLIFLLGVYALVGSNRPIVEDIPSLDIKDDPELNAWCKEERIFQKFRQDHPTFCRLPSGDWGVTVPIEHASPNGEPEYECEVHRKDGTITRMLVSEGFTVTKGDSIVAICDILAEVDQ